MDSDNDFSFGFQDIKPITLLGMRRGVSPCSVSCKTSYCSEVEGVILCCTRNLVKGKTGLTSSYLFTPLLSLSSSESSLNLYPPSFPPNAAANVFIFFPLSFPDNFISPFLFATRLISIKPLFSLPS